MVLRNPDDGFRHFDSVNSLGDIVNTQYGSAIFDTECGENRGGIIPFAGIFNIKQSSDKCFTGVANKDGAVKILESGEIFYDGEIIRGYFSSTIQTTVNLSIYTYSPAQAYSNINSSTAMFHDGATTFALNLIPEGSSSPYYKAEFEIQGVNAQISAIDNVGVHEQGFSMLSNFPNPFNAVTEIQYYIPEESQVTINIYNLKGQIIRTLVNKIEQPGEKSIFWDGKDNFGTIVTSGMYIYTLVNNNSVYSKKLIMLK